MGELAAKARDYEEAIMHYEKAVDLYQSDVGSSLLSLIMFRLK